jgi:hypothetical protein
MENFARIAEQVVDFAGLSRVVRVRFGSTNRLSYLYKVLTIFLYIYLFRGGKIIQGSSTPVLKSLRGTLNMPRPSTFDMIFIDHHKVREHDFPSAWVQARTPDLLPSC